MTGQAQPVHQRYLALVEQLEARFDVTRWRSGDIDLWPPARMDLFLDLFRSAGGDTARPAPSLPWRAVQGLAMPLTNAWKSRRDLEHWRPWPKAADVILLGDGVSMDKTDGAWGDRHGEPVMAALERKGLTTFLMQPGGLDRLPWARPTFAANTISVRAALTAALDRNRSVDLPDHAAVLEFLDQAGVEAPSLAPARLAKRARTIAAAARAFQRLLRRVRPRLAFAVTYYAGLGHAFALACRREGVMCVDLQHCPQEGVHRAYRWDRLPDDGYSTLPAVFWTWSREDAARVAGWGDGRAAPWHVAVHGGHCQLAPYADGQGPAHAWDARFAAVAAPDRVERDILVALQPIGGRRAVWEALARSIDQGPAHWRWWIRRHPSSSPFQDGEYQDLLALRRPNVVIKAASELPLPALLKHMNALVSLASGAAAEAAAFGVPALFLDGEAFGSFPGLIARGQAQVVDISDVLSRIAQLPLANARPAADAPPPLDETLLRLERMAQDYAKLALERRRGG